MNLQMEINSLKQRIAELEEQDKQEQDFPEHCDDYWFLSGGGTIDDSFYTDSHVDNKRMGMGNMFRTRQEAVFAVEKLKVEAELRKFSRPFEIYGTNYYLYFAKDDGFIGIACLTTSLAQGAIYFESENKAQQAIQSVGEERIKKYIFGVED